MREDAYYVWQGRKVAGYILERPSQCTLERMTIYFTYCCALRSQQVSDLMPIRLVCDNVQH